MAQHKLGTVNLGTGEILEGAVLGVIFPKRHNGFNGWFAMNQSALKALRSSGLQGRDYEVLFALLEFLDFDNWIRISKADLAEELSMQSTHVGRSIRRLLEIGALLEGPKVGRSVTYRLNPSFGWKGSAKSHNNALKARMEERGLTLIDTQK